MTKKIGVLLAVILAVFSIQTASAQIRYGVRAGVDVINSDVNSSMMKLSNHTGYLLGGSLDLTVPLIGLGVETGLQFGHKSMKAKGKADDTVTRMTDYNYVTVPVLIKKTFSVFGLAGVYFTGGVYGNMKISGGNAYVGDVKYASQKFQKGLAAGAGVSLLNHVELGLNYRHRLGDNYPDAGKQYNLSKVDRNTWTVTLAYYL